MATRTAMPRERNQVVLEGADLRCPGCAEKPELVQAQAFYQRWERKLANRWLWICQACDTRIGCHPGTTEPLGTMAGPELRRARSRAHEAFDPIWQDEPPWRAKSARGRAYRWLAEQLGLHPDDCHIGMMDEATCARVVLVCTTHRAQLEFGVCPEE